MAGSAISPPRRRARSAAVARALLALAAAAAALPPAAALSLPASIAPTRAVGCAPPSSSSTSLSASAGPIGVATSVPPSYGVLFGLSLKRSSAEKRPLFSVPSVFGPSDSRPVVLFDGKCNLCNAGVQLILDTDRASSDPRGNLRVAALQSRVGRVLLARLPPEQRETVLSVKGDEGKEYKSIVVAGENRTWLNSAACIRIGRELKGPLRYLALLAGLIPAFIRDPLYKLMSRYRKRIFGESEGCRLWDDNWDTRFVDDAMFGGRSSEVDPFADPNAVQEEDDDDDDDDDDVEEAPPGTPPLEEGDSVRVVSSKPIIHADVAGHEDDGGVCSVGLVGTVTRVLDRNAYPKNVAVKFQLEGEGAASFEAHFFPGQLRKE